MRYLHSAGTVFDLDAVFEVVLELAVDSSHQLCVSAFHVQADFVSSEGAVVDVYHKQTAIDHSGAEREASCLTIPELAKLEAYCRLLNQFCRSCIYDSPTALHKRRVKDVDNFE